MSWRLCSESRRRKRPAGDFESDAALTPQNPIDELVFARLKELNIQPARLCSDAVFVRRVYLDVIGTLPKGLEAEQFLLSTIRTSAAR